MADRLSGKRILITGAAQGIGLAIVRACLGEGAAVVLMDRDAALLARSVADLGGEAEYLTALAGDITNTDDVAGVVVRAQETIGPLNALINNAGINVFDEPLSLSDEDWNRCFDVNLKGAWNCARAVLPGLLEQGGGVILNIASTHAFTIIPHTFPYPLAKHALLGLTKSLALEYAAQNVRVNALAPGYVQTQKVVEYWNSFPDPEAARQETLRLHPGGRIATPEEIGRAAVFMISDECPFMNAACLTVDGGLSVQQHPA
ncbi:short-chain dehydrogenase [Labrenzia sp. C1B10]|uniref:SDR family oxidoreductase n=1 Tax=unclassified Labrenzia TaxID=2648686 RepID=UPI0003B8BF48|nr:MULTISPECIES: SDR family oxidoreductase [unclassified Labrenzia]ERP96651.1 short-chain dehydrogenase [Labrenzia sp. C1B10]ERS06492.1 short-chain dehydrogenase [Labrenzia sp. C1B70]